MALTVVDRAMQSYGAEGISQDQDLAYTYAGLRTLRYADGPDEVHIQQVGQRELRRAKNLHSEAAVLKQKQNALLEKNGFKANL